MSSLRRRWVSRIRRGESGQGLVEFALIVPLVLLLLVGVFEFANAWRAYQVVTDAGRELTRRLVADSTSVPTQSAADALVANTLSRAGLTGVATVSVQNCRTFCSPQGQPYDPYTVTISYPQKMGLLDKLIGIPAVQLKSTFVMRSEY